MFRCRRSSTTGISFIWTPWNWGGVSPSIFLMNKLKVFDVSSSSFWFPSKWRARARKRHKLSVYGCLVFSPKVRQLTVCFSNRGYCRTASLHPIGTSLRKAANTVKFVNLYNLYFVFKLFLLHDSMTSVLLRLSFRFVRSSLVHTSFDRSSSVLFSCAYKYLNLPSSIFFNMNPNARFTFSCAIQVFEDMVKFFFHNFCAKSFYCIIKHFEFHLFNFRVNKKMLTRLYFILKILVVKAVYL